MTDHEEITLRELIESKFDLIRIQYENLRDDVGEIKETCKSRLKCCGAQIRAVDARMDAIEQDNARRKGANDAGKDLEKTRLSKQQIVSNGISGMLGAVVAALIMLLLKVFGS